MGKFDDYMQMRQQRQVDQFYETEKNKQLEEKESNYLDQEQLDQKLSEKIFQPKFKDQTKYYFEDHKLMEAKAERYQKMGDDEDGNMAQFAEAHQNRSARKRKKSAKSAASSFRKAAALEQTPPGNDASGMELFAHRQKIMDIRLEGMISAAKAKSVNKKDEDYRIAKAKLTCIQIMQRQLAELGNKMSDDEYNEEKKKMMKRALIAEKEWKKVIPSPDDTWRNENGIDDPEVIKKMYKKGKKINPEFTMDNAKELALYNSIFQNGSKEASEVIKTVFEKGTLKLTDGDGDRIVRALMFRVKRDKNGIPINDEEKKREAWNKKWFDNIKSDATETDPEKLKELKAERFEMYKQHCDHFMKVELPEPDEIKAKGVEYFYHKDPIGFYELIHFSLTFDNLIVKEPELKNYIKEHPELDRRMRSINGIGSLWAHFLGDTHHINQITADVKNKSIVEEDTWSMRDAEELYENEYYTEINQPKMIAKYKQEYNLPSFEERKKKAPNMTQEEYDLFVKFRRSVLVYNQPDLATKVMEGKRNKIFEGKGEEVSISRAFAPLIQSVNLDGNGAPVTEEDKKNLEFNKKWVKAVVEKKDHRRDELIEEHVPKIFEKFEPPKPEELTPEFFENIIKNDINGFLELRRKAIGIDNLKNVAPKLKEMLEKDPILARKSQLASDLASMFEAYVNINYHFDANSGEPLDPDNVGANTFTKVYYDSSFENYKNHYTST